MDTVFHHQMKHLEVRQKYSAARCIFNSLVLRLMLDIQDYLTYVLQDNCKWASSKQSLLFRPAPLGSVFAGYPNVEIKSWPELLSEAKFLK